MIIRTHGVHVEVSDDFRVQPANRSDAEPLLRIEIVDDERTPTFWIDDRMGAEMIDDCVYAWIIGDMGPNTLEHYVLDHVIPRALTELGMPILHAAGVAHDGRGVILSGESGAGKSTLSLWLASRGWTFFGDDGIRVESGDDGLWMWPALADARIHLDARALFFDDSAAAGAVTDSGSKQRLIVPPGAMATERERAVIVVSIDSEPCAGPPVLEPISRAETARDLAVQTFWEEGTAADAIARIDVALEQTRLVSGFKLSYPRVPDAMPTIEALIIDALASIESSSN